MTTGNPRVAYRETITQRADFNYIHKKQTGGSGQYGRIAGYIEPTTEGTSFIFDNQITGGAIPTQYIPACEKGFRQSLAKGPKTRVSRLPVSRWPLMTGPTMPLIRPIWHSRLPPVGLSEKPISAPKPVVHEPIMKVVVESPTEFQGAVMGLLNQRRGMIVGAQDEGHMMCCRGAGPPGGDVRFFHGAAVGHPGEGPVHHGICSLSAGASIHRGEDR